MEHFDLFRFNLKKDVKRYLFHQKRLNRKNFIEDQKLCKRIKEKYEPFGLEKELPKDLLDLCSSTNGELLINVLSNKYFLFIDFLLKSFDPRYELKLSNLFQNIVNVIKTDQSIQDAQNQDLPKA